MSEVNEDELQHIVSLKMQIQRGNEKNIRQLRRQIRNRIFRIRQGRDGFDNGLRRHIEAQLNPDQSLDTFTFNWDVSPTDPLTVITPFEWESSGGKFEVVNVLDESGIPRQVRICDPAAFTKQE